MSFWRSRADSSSNNKLIREYVGPNKYNVHPVEYITKSEAAIYADFCEENPHLVSYVSLPVFRKHKPFWIRPHEWLTCKCPACHEIEGLLNTFVRNVPAWHKSALKTGHVNDRPPNTCQCCARVLYMSGVCVCLSLSSCM